MILRNPQTGLCDEVPKAAAKLFRALALVAGLLSGCATLPVAGDADPRLVSALKEIPRDGVWERIQCWSGVRLLVSERVATAAISICAITVNPRILLWPHDDIRTVLAHELGHMFNNDFSTLRVGVPQIEKERQADAVAARLLSRISLGACIALPQLLEKLPADPSHPHPVLRGDETRSLCYELAKRS